MSTKIDKLKPVLRGALFSLLIALGPLTILVLAPLMDSQYIDPGALPIFILLSIGFGVAVYLVGLLTKRLQAKLGRYTGYAALAGGVAVIATALALVVEECPGSLTGEACTVPEAASWGLSSALLVILLVLLWVIATGAVNLTKKGIAYARTRREARNQTTGEPKKVKSGKSKQSRNQKSEQRT